MKGDCAELFDYCNQKMIEAAAVMVYIFKIISYKNYPSAKMSKRGRLATVVLSISAGMIMTTTNMRMLQRALVRSGLSEAQSSSIR